MVRAVIFDVDDTLYDFTAADRKAFAALQDFARGRFGVPGEQFAGMHRSMMRELAERLGPIAASHNRLIRYQNMLERMGQPVSYALEMCNLYWDTLIACAVPFDGLLDALAALKRRGVWLGVGTNMTALVQFRKLEKLGVLPLVDYVVSSEEAGVDKPFKGFFDFCVSKAGCAAGECLFMGDSMAIDVQGALNAGLRAAWFHPADAAEGNAARIASWRDLCAYVEGCR